MYFKKYTLTANSQLGLHSSGREENKEGQKNTYRSKSPSSLHFRKQALQN